MELTLQGELVLSDGTHVSSIYSRPYVLSFDIRNSVLHTSIMEATLRRSLHVGEDWIV